MKKKQMVIISIIIIIALVFINTKTEVKRINNKEAYKSNYVVVEAMKNNMIQASSAPKVVYDDLTLEELANKLEKSLNSDISGKGMLIASYALEKGVDPYMAVAIILHETGCKWNCSYLVKKCNNVGGQKGKGCGSYSYFNSLDEGIKAFIDNLQKNYISHGLTTPEEINTKYASNKSWSVKINKYIDSVKAQ